MFGGQFEPFEIFPDTEEEWTKSKESMPLDLTPVDSLIEKPSGCYLPRYENYMRASSSLKLCSHLSG